MIRLLLIVVCLFFIAPVRSQGIFQLWGMTVYGGTADGGVIFKTDGRGNNFEKVYDFDTEGNSPAGSLTFYNGKLYGMAMNGGLFNGGVIFEFDPVTNTYSPKVDLAAGPDGYAGSSKLVLFGNKFYGIAAGGGANDMGVIFEWDPVTNIYTKKIDRTGVTGAAPGRGVGTLTLAGNKFYGINASGGANDEGTLFEWDPVTNIYTSWIDFTGLSGAFPSPYHSYLQLYNGKLYGTALSGGAFGFGLIYEWDPQTHIYTKRIDFSGDLAGGATGSSPFSGLTLSGQKFYGATLDGGINALGLIYEWDPVTNDYNVLESLDGFTTGKWPMSRLGTSGGRLYGMLGNGGLNDKGLLFEWDPATHIFTNREEFDGLNAGISAEGNMIISVQAPIAPGSPGTCVTYNTVTIDNTNNNEWLPIVDNLGRAIAEIKANGNNLGIVVTELYINNGTIREDENHRVYLDRNLTITPQVPASGPVDIRLYITDEEFESIRTSVYSTGHPSGIHAIEDLGIFKNSDGCSAALSAGASGIVTSAESWHDGYVLTANISSFSSFYFANKASVTLPLDFITFTGRIDGDDALLNWETANEVNTSFFEIEKSVDGRNFTVAGNIPAANLPGTNRYAFKDANIALQSTAVLYYRIKQTDSDGRFTYSTTVALRFDNKPGFRFYPNPVTNSANLVVTINASEQLQLRVIDIAGREVKRQMHRLTAGSTSVAVDVEGVANGMYYLEVRGTTVNSRIKFLKH